MYTDLKIRNQDVILFVYKSYLAQNVLSGIVPNNCDFVYYIKKKKNNNITKYNK